MQVEKQLDEVMPALFDALGAPSDRVVLQALAVQASLAASPPHFRFLGAQLLNRHAPHSMRSCEPSILFADNLQSALYRIMRSCEALASDPCSSLVSLSDLMPPPSTSPSHFRFRGAQLHNRHVPSDFLLFLVPQLYRLKMAASFIHKAIHNAPEFP